jgi:hypothetical protein
VLVVRWIGLPSSSGQHFLLDTGTVYPRRLQRGTFREALERSSYRLVTCVNLIVSDG